MFKLAKGASRVKHSKLQRYVRTERYKYEDYNWNLMNGPGHNDFKGIVDTIRTSQGDVSSAAEGGKRGNRKHSSRKTRRFIRRNIRRSRKHKSKRSKRY